MCFKTLRINIGKSYIVPVIALSRCAKFQSHMSMDFKNIWGGKTLT
jgi:hypothetical protein